MEDVMKNVKPTIVGRIRKEAFGGIYYERDRLVIELLNDSAYEILSLCQQGKTQEEKMKEKERRLIFIDFLEQLLKIDPNERITPEEALSHKFIVSYLS